MLFQLVFSRAEAIRESERVSSMEGLIRSIDEAATFLSDLKAVVEKSSQEENENKTKDIDT